MGTVAIIQTRMGSTRLAGKVLSDIMGKPMVWHVVNRLRHTSKLNDIILAVPDTKENDVLESFAKENNIKYFRGSEENVLSRYYETAKKFKSDLIVRITSDCPLIDPKVVDLVIEKHLNSGADYTSNVLKRTFPRGLDVEVFDFKTLEMAYKQAKQDFQKEHVTSYIYKHTELFHLNSIENNEDFSYMRWCVDEIKDLELVREIYSRLYKNNKIFLLKDIVNLFEKSPELLEINQNVRQKRHEESF